MPVVDAHVHVGAAERWIPEGLELARQLGDESSARALDPDGPVGKTVGPYLAGQGVDVGLAIPCGREALQEYTIEESEQADGRLVALVQYDPRTCPDAVTRLDKAISRGARGLKVHPASHQIYPNDRAMYPLYGLCSEAGVPVMFHVGSSVFPGAKMKFCDPMWVDEVACDFPRLPVICAHAGRGFWTDQVSFLARMRDNVYLEMSGIPPRRIPEWFPDFDKLGDRVLFGSDWPASPPVGQLVEQTRRLPYSPELIDNLLWRNADRLFGLGLAVPGNAR